MPCFQQAGNRWQRALTVLGCLAVPLIATADPLPTQNRPQDDGALDYLQGHEGRPAANWADEDSNGESSLPSMHRGETKVTRQEVVLGQAWLRQFRARAPLWQDPLVNDYLERQIARLVPHTPLGNLDITSLLVDSASLNAFAVPGGVIGVNSGLFTFAEDEGAFTSVLAHELGHLSQRHYARATARDEKIRLPAMATMLAGMLIAAGGGGDAGMAAAIGSQAAIVQDRLAYSRRFEEEADRIGLDTLAAAGYAPSAMVRMLTAMQQKARLQGGTPPEFLLTHPITDSRLSDTQQRAARATAPSTLPDQTRYQMMRARALLQVHKDSTAQARQILRQSTDDPVALGYFDALVKARKGNTQDALALLDQLHEQAPDYTAIPATAAHLALQARRHQEAAERSRRLLRVVPDHLPTQLTLAQARLHLDPEAAFEQLRSVTAEHPDHPQAFDLLAQAAGRTDRSGWGHLARAEFLQLTGHIDRAIKQLDIAEQRTLDATDSTAKTALTARLQARRQAFMGFRESIEAL